MILLIVYMIAGYWAAGKTIYANKVVIYSGIGTLFIQKLIFGTVLGFILIPWAILKTLGGR